MLDNACPSGPSGGYTERWTAMLRRSMEDLKCRNSKIESESPVITEQPSKSPPMLPNNQQEQSSKKKGKAREPSLYEQEQLAKLKSSIIAEQSSTSLSMAQDNDHQQSSRAKGKAREMSLFERQQQEAELAELVAKEPASQAPQPNLPQSIANANALAGYWLVDSPPEMSAWLSTHGGKYPKRIVGASRPPDIARSDPQVDATKRVEELVRKFPEKMGEVQQPTNWNDLQSMWDVHDIWVEDAGFLYGVMHLIADKNAHHSRVMAVLDEYAHEWVINNMDWVLKSDEGTMYEFFYKDKSGSDGFDETYKPSLSMFLEAYRLEVIKKEAYKDACRNRSLSNNGIQDRQGRSPSTSPDASGTEPKSNGIDPAHVQMTSIQPSNGTSISQLTSTRESENKPALDGSSSTQARTTSVESSNKAFLSLSATTTPKQYTGGNSAPTHFNMPSRPYEAFPRFDGSPARFQNNRANNTFRNNIRPHGNSIDATRINNNQWPAHYGAHQNQHIRQTQPNHPQNMLGNMRANPGPINSEPIYIRNIQHNRGPSGGSLNQMISNNIAGESYMYLPNDSRNMNAFPHSGISHSINFGGMEGDPNFQKREDSCIYRYYLVSGPRNDFGRTMYLKGPDLNMFCTHQLKDLMSTVGPVVSIKLLIRRNQTGPFFVTFESDVVADAIQKFDGYRLADGRSFTAGYPIDNHMRHRSGSNDSHHSHHSHNHTRYPSNPGLNGPSNPRGSTISQHRPSRSLSINGFDGSFSGHNPFQYTNGNHIMSQNNGVPSQNTPVLQFGHPYSGPHMPVSHQQAPAIAPGGFSAIISQIVQHERGFERFQQHMPLAPMNLRGANIATTNSRPDGGFQGRPARVMTRFDHGTSMTNMHALPERSKENSPVKKESTSNTHSSPLGKTFRRNNNKQKKSLTPRRNTSTRTTPSASPTKTDTAFKSTLQMALNEQARSSTIGQMEATKEPKDPSSECITPAPVEASEQVNPGRTKKAKRSKKAKSCSKATSDRGEDAVASPSAIVSPIDSGSIESSHIRGGRFPSGDSTRNPSLISTDSNLEKPLQESVCENKIEKSFEKEEASIDCFVNQTTNRVWRRGRTHANSESKHRTIHSSPAEGLKMNSQSSSLDSFGSQTTSTSIQNAGDVKAKTHAEYDQDDGGAASMQEGQAEMNLNTDNKYHGVPETNKGGEFSSPEVVMALSVMATEKPSPSSVTDMHSLPLLPKPQSVRSATGVILPALPLKPNRKSNDTLGSKDWPFVRNCKRQI